MHNLLLGNCLEMMKSLNSDSIDAIITDPPYGLAFMGKKWDYDVPSKEIWAEALRVLKPGGHLLSFGGTRTYHRMVVNIEDAGFEIRDQIQWLYGSGFPKSHNISKSIDKAAGAERKIVGFRDPKKSVHGAAEPDSTGSHKYSGNLRSNDPSTNLAKQWDGWGTALKPANEPICLARKPLEGTVAQNIEKWGVGGINIEGCRVNSTAADQEKMKVPIGKIDSGNVNMHRSGDRTETFQPNTQGRWPANLLLDETAAEMLDAQSLAGGMHSAGKARPKQLHRGDFGISDHGQRTRLADHRLGDSGGASRFFYVAKASKSERNAGLEGMPTKFTATMNDGIGKREHNPDEPRAYNQNFHPTIKPLKLMEYLCKLITPPTGTILDPFMGSGTTGVAAKNLGFKFVGIEMNEEYFEIAKRRIG